MSASTASRSCAPASCWSAEPPGGARRSPTSPRGATRTRSGRSAPPSRAPSSSTATPTRSTTAPCSRSPPRRTSCSRPWSPAPRPAPSGSTSPPTRARTLASGRSTSARSSGSPRASARARVSWRSSSASAHRRARGAGVPLRRARHRPEAGASAPTFAAAGSRRSASGCARASCARTSARPRPIRRAGARHGHGAPAAGGVQRRARHGRPRASARRSPPSCASPAAGSAGVRAIAIDLGDRAQISTNVHDPARVPLGTVIERVRALAAPTRCAGRSPARSSGWSRKPPCATFPTTCRYGASTPSFTCSSAGSRLGHSAADVVHVPPLVGAVHLRPAVDRADLVDHRPHLGAGEVDRGPVLVRRAAGRVRGRADAREVEVVEVGLLLLGAVGRQRPGRVDVDPELGQRRPRASPSRRRRRWRRGRPRRWASRSGPSTRRARSRARPTAWRLGRRGGGGRGRADLGRARHLDRRPGDHQGLGGDPVVGRQRLGADPVRGRDPGQRLALDHGVGDRGPRGRGRGAGEQARRRGRERGRSSPLSPWPGSHQTSSVGPWLASPAHRAALRAGVVMTPERARACSGGAR